MNPSMYKAGRAWKRATSRKRRQLQEPLAIYMKLFIFTTDKSETTRICVF